MKVLLLNLSVEFVSKAEIIKTENKHTTAMIAAFQTIRGPVRSPRRADRRWALAPTSRTGLHVQLRYVGPRPWRAF